MKISAFLLILSALANGQKLRIISAKVADVESAGMDGGKFGINFFGGGEFSIELCNDSEVINF